MRALTIAASALLITASAPAMAYVGPGAGLSVLGAFWGLVVAVVAALGFVIVWPFRHMLRSRKPNNAAASARAGKATPSGAGVSKEAA